MTSTVTCIISESKILVTDPDATKRILLRVLRETKKFRFCSGTQYVPVIEFGSCGARCSVQDHDSSANFDYEIARSGSLLEDEDQLPVRSCFALRRVWISRPEFPGHRIDERGSTGALSLPLQARPVRAAVTVHSPVGGGKDGCETSQESQEGHQEA